MNFANTNTKITTTINAAAVGEYIKQGKDKLTRLVQE